MDQSESSDSDADAQTPPSDGTNTTSNSLSILLSSLLCHFFLTFLGVEAILVDGNFIVSPKVHSLDDDGFLEDPFETGSFSLLPPHNHHENLVKETAILAKTNYESTNIFALLTGKDNLLGPKVGCKKDLQVKLFASG